MLAAANYATQLLLVMDDQPPKKPKVVDTREPVAPEPALAQIYVKAIDGTIVDARELPLNATAAELKAFVAERTGELAANFSLALGEFKMDDARSLAEHGIVAGVVEVTMIISGLNLETDKEALIAFYNSTNGAQWTMLLNNRNWLTDAPVGEWYGVTVEGGRVVKLELENNNLQGV